MLTVASLSEPAPVFELLASWANVDEASSMAAAKNETATINFTVVFFIVFSIKISFCIGQKRWLLIMG